MFKVSLHFTLPALLLVAGAAEPRAQHVVATDSPAQLYTKCTTVGSDDYDGRQCIVFRAAAEQEIAACVAAGGAANGHGYRALRLRCAEQQALRFGDPVE